MEEKTEELRDIFLSVSEEETVTESQAEQRGSLTDQQGSVETRIGAVIDQLREKFGFEASLSDSKRCELVELFYEEQSDDALATALETDTETVFTARMDLHLVREAEPALDEATLELLRDRPAAEIPDLATETGKDEETLRRAQRILDTEARSRRVSHRFRTEFEEILTDSVLRGQFASDAHEDGLDEATEGAEVDVDF